MGGFKDTVKEFNCEELNNCSVLVTGASGFIGTMLVKVLKEISEERHLNLRILPLSRKQGYISIEHEKCEVEAIYGDIMEKINVPGDLDYIIHCASITDSKTMKNYPVETFLTSVDGTRNILELARQKKIKSMVYLSSMEMYGTEAEKTLKSMEHSKYKESDFVTEDMLGYIDLKSPRSSYPEGKRAAEFLCNAYHSEYGVPVKIARLAQTFGPGVSKTDNRVFAQFARSVINGTDIVLHTDGNSEGNYCHIKDTISGILTILLEGQSGEAYNVANENLHMTIRQMAEFVANKVGKGKIKVITQTPNNPNGYGYAPPTKLRLSSEKLRALGWNPEFNMQDMYEHMIEYWKELKEQTTT